MTYDQNNALTIPEMVEIARAATPIDLDSAERVTVGEIVCPLCNDGALDHQAWVNIDDRPVGIEVFGVGETLTAYEAFVRTFNPAAVIALLEENARLKVQVEAACDAADDYERAHEPLHDRVQAAEARAIAAEAALKEVRADLKGVCKDLDASEARLSAVETALLPFAAYGRASAAYGALHRGKQPELSKSMAYVQTEMGHAANITWGDFVVAARAMPKAAYGGDSARNRWFAATGEDISSPTTTSEA